MSEPATVVIDEKLFQEVAQQQRRVESARGIYKDAKSEAKEAKDALDQALETFETMFKRLVQRTNGEPELPLFDSQNDAIARAEGDPVVTKLVDRLLARGHDVNALIVFGYTAEERNQVATYLDLIDERDRLKAEGAIETLLEDVEVPAFLLPQPLTAVEVADLINRLQEAGEDPSPDDIERWTRAQLAEVKQYLTDVERIKAAKGDALTADDLPEPPACFGNPDDEDDDDGDDESTTRAEA